MNYDDSKVAYTIMKEIKSEQAHIPHTPTLLDNYAHNEWQCHALVIDNQTYNHN